MAVIIAEPGIVPRTQIRPEPPSEVPEPVLDEERPEPALPPNRMLARASTRHRGC
jgi:hypothetical protein